MATKEDIPSVTELMLPNLQAIEMLGGSAQGRQLTDATVEWLAPSEDLLAITYPGREKSIYLDRVRWARSYCKLIGALGSPKRGLYLLTARGQEILALPENQAVERLRELTRAAAAARRSQKSAGTSGEAGETEDVATLDSQDAPDDEAAQEDTEEEPTEWREELLARLHEMSPTGFERFVLFLLRSFGLELEHTGGSGDEGIDGIGIAPISPVLSAKVAVQVKRYNPASSAGIGRKEVALFQRDAEVAGAERAIMVSLGRYTKAARKASQATTPMVDLIDGEKLCDLVREQEVGIRIVPEVAPEFFDRFESAD